MTSGQRQLIDKTLGVLATLGLIAVIATPVIGLVSMLRSGQDAAWFFSGLFSPGDGGLLLYPGLAVFVGARWIRAFLRRGQEDDPGGAR